MLSVASLAAFSSSGISPVQPTPVRASGPSSPPTPCRHRRRRGRHPARATAGRSRPARCRAVLCSTCRSDRLVGLTGLPRHGAGGTLAACRNSFAAFRKVTTASASSAPRAAMSCTTIRRSWSAPWWLPTATCCCAAARSSRGWATGLFRPAIWSWTRPWKKARRAKRWRKRRPPLPSTASWRCSVLPGSVRCRSFSGRASPNRHSRASLPGPRAWRSGCMPGTPSRGTRSLFRRCAGR